jgi:mycofactocin glycosyltransferase
MSAPPPGLVVRLAPEVVVHDAGRLVIGGAPLRLMRLNARGAGQIARWRAGAAIGDDPAARALAGRLLDAGILLAEPHPEPARLARQVTVAVPVRDRADELARCLGALAADAPDVPILVVDDASADPEAIARVAGDRGAAVLRLDRPHGAAGARNAALRAVSTPLIAFVDSDVVVEPGWLARLVASFSDPQVAAAAPRVAPLRERGGLLTEYEARHSSLDMGRRPGLVGIGRAVSYIPSAALIVRREVALEFDSSLNIGEDVDFVWRLADRGWRVRYDPGATVRHDHRVQLRPFVRRRLTYAWSIGLLARRHPHALPAAWVEPWSASALLLLCSGRKKGILGAAVTLAVRVITMRARLRRHTRQPTRLAARLTARTVIGTARGFGHAIRRAWSPILLPLAWRSRRVRLVLATAAVGAVADERVRLRHVPLKALDDALAAVGTWGSSLDQRTTRPLLPSRPCRRTTQRSV